MQHAWQRNLDLRPFTSFLAIFILSKSLQACSPMYKTHSSHNLRVCVVRIHTKNVESQTGRGHFILTFETSTKDTTMRCHICNIFIHVRNKALQLQHATPHTHTQKKKLQKAAQRVLNVLQPPVFQNTAAKIPVNHCQVLMPICSTR